MALFDTLIREVSQKFNLGGNAERLVIELLRAMNSPQTGGLGGFLDKFRKAGLGDMVASWVGRGENQALTPTQTEQALGQGFSTRSPAGRASRPRRSPLPSPSSFRG